MDEIAKAFLFQRGFEGGQDKTLGGDLCLRDFKREDSFGNAKVSHSDRWKLPKHRLFCTVTVDRNQVTEPFKYS
jgi:hypothetical protein